jgi:hypothetical protein
MLASHGQDLPLPRCDDIIDFASRVTDSEGNSVTPQWWHTFDLASGFFGIPVAPEHRHRAAFITAKGVWQFKVLPFGLAHAPILQQRVAEAVMTGLVWNICACYLDDCCCPALDFEDGLKRLEMLLERYIGANLSLKASILVPIVQAMSPVRHVNVPRTYARQRRGRRCEKRRAL